MSVTVTGTSPSGEAKAAAAPVTIRRYFAEKFPAPQVVAISLGSVASYVVYGRIAGDVRIDMGALLTAATAVLLFLQIRLSDDCCTLWDPKVVPDTPATAPPLIGGFLATMVAVYLLNPQPVPRAFAFGVTAMIAICAIALPLVGRGYLPFHRNVPMVPFIELSPALILCHVYLTWHAWGGPSLSPAVVAAVVGFFWSSYQFWKLTRYIGARPHERNYRLSWNVVRMLAVGLLAVAFVCNVVLYFAAHLSIVYLGYAIALIVVFTVLAWPRGVPETVWPWWAGLPFAAASMGGLIIQLAVA